MVSWSGCREKISLKESDKSTFETSVFVKRCTFACKQAKNGSFSQYAIKQEHTKKKVRTWANSFFKRVPWLLIRVAIGHESLAD